jgi:hypothetical protein
MAVAQCRHSQENELLIVRGGAAWCGAPLAAIVLLYEKELQTMLKSVTIGFILLNSMLFCSGQISRGEDKSYGIRHYDLLIEPDFKTKSVSLTASVVIKNPALLDSFVFGLNNRYESVNVTCPSSPVVVERANGWITVKSSTPTEEMTLLFQLKGTLGKSDDEDREIVADSSLFLLWSDRFYPIDFDRWANVRVEIVLPVGFQAIAPGRLTKTENSDTATRYVFESNVPMVNFSVFADSRWIKTERQINGIQMQTLLYPGSQKFSDQIFTTSGEILGFYSSVFCPYPFEQFSFVTISEIFARRAFAGFIGYEPRYLEKEFTTTGHDAHESSLLWWGYTTRGSGPGSFQWTEGFGDYAEILYDEAYHKPIPRIFERFREGYLAQPAEQDVLYTDLRGNTPQKIVHGKYPWLMHVIRYAVGDSAFFRAMRLLFERLRFRTFSMDEFIMTLEEGCGQSLQWWREEWLERKGVPEIAMKSQIQKGNSQYHVTCILEQRGNIYHFPLEIGIESSKGLQVEKVTLSKRQARFTFESKDKPTRILLDPRGWVLMKATLVK